MSFGVVAAVGGAVAIGGAVAGGIMSSQSAGRAARSQEQAAGQFQSKRQRALSKFEEDQLKLQKEFQAINPNINVPRIEIQNLAGATTQAIEAANKVTENTLQQLRKVDPAQEGAVQAAYQNLAQAQSLASQFLTQGAPEESRRAVLRQAAETGGAGFNIATAGRGAGIQGPQARYAQMLGLQDIEFRRMGAQMAQDLGNTAMNWRSVSASFLQPVSQMIGLGAGITGMQLTQRAQDIGIEQQNIANRFRQLGVVGDINTQLYGAKTGTAKDIYGAQSESIQARLAADQASAQAIQGIASATSGALMGIGGAMGGAQAAGGFGGGFSTIGQARQAAPFASGFSNVYGMGYVPRATAV